MTALSVLAVAVASGKVGYVYLSGGRLQDWGITLKATRSANDLVGFVQELINELKPDVVVTEKRTTGCRKGQRTKALIQAIAELASHNSVLDVSVQRPRGFPSKYEEAQALAMEYPEIEGYLPRQRRRIFDFEPRSMVLFEALALADAVIKEPPTRLAAAMG
ncbi:hypothetical protein [Roseobacter sp. CCS2]|uniref:hypothetical protein n=1 Tax=Roseobacter sp. CCS2 TaxID=391593 RepID=UPI0000F3E41C|nr:hypothetical protein [Roseobacter sp. CCS2]EBA12654.1 hypothetical protein RCCS2_15194 [Roseobacter sp. CCS2]